MAKTKKSQRLSNDQATLYDRLECKGFSEKKIKSDGNCQFRSIADQLYKSSDKHNLVRQEIVKQLKSCPGAYKGFVTNMDDVSENRKKKNKKMNVFDEYVNNMSKNSVWGDHITLKAAADKFKVKIVVISSYEDSSPLEILPKSQKSDKVIYLSFLAEYHYNSIHLTKGAVTDTASTEIQSEHTEIQSEHKEEKTENKKKNKKEKMKNKKK